MVKQPIFFDDVSESETVIRLKKYRASKEDTVFKLSKENPIFREVYPVEYVKDVENVVVLLKLNNDPELKESYVFVKASLNIRHKNGVDYVSLGYMDMERDIFYLLEDTEDEEFVKQVRDKIKLSQFKVPESSMIVANLHERVAYVLNMPITVPSGPDPYSPVTSHVNMKISLSDNDLFGFSVPFGLFTHLLNKERKNDNR